MAAEVENLAKLGWHITEAGLKKLSAGQKLPESEVIKLAEDTDIKDYGKGHIPENWSKKDMVTIDGVLQVQKVRNVAAPKANEESQGAPRLLRVTLSDGATTVTALEVGRPWSRLTLRTPPGTKIRLRQAVPVCAGFLLVPDAALQMIGGNVQLMVDKWLMAKAFASQNLRPSGGAAGAPPPWVPFGKSISAAHKAERDFKSLVGGDQAPVDAEFEAQRKAQIAQLANTGRKQFGGGTKQMTDGNLETLMGAGFSQAEAEAALKHTYNDVGRAMHNLQRFRARRDGREGTDGDTGRGGRGGRFGRRRYDDDAEDGAARPSEPVTLLDFVGLKIGTDNTGSSDQHSTPAAVDSDSDRTGGSFNDRGDRGGYGRGYDSDRRGYGGDRGGRGRGYRGDRGGRGYSGDRGGSGRGYDNDRGERGYGSHRGGSGRGYSDDRGGSRGRGYSNDRGGSGRGYSADRGGYNSDRGGYNNDRGGSGRGYSNDRGGSGRGYGSDRGSSGRGYSSDRGGYNSDRGGYNSSDRGGSSRGGGGRGRGRGGGSERSRVSSDEFVEGRRARDRRQGTSGPRDLRTAASDTRSSPGFAALSEDRQMFPDLSGETTGQGGEVTSRGGDMARRGGETASRGGDTSRRGGQTAGRGGRTAVPTTAAAEQKHLYTEGEMCLALYWEDKQMYLARIISVGERTAVVNFVDYGEHYEEVLTSNMKPLGFEEEETPARQAEPRRSEKPPPMDREQSETSSLFSHSRRPAGRREEDDQRGYMDRPPRFNGTEHGGGDGDRGDTYRNDRRDTYRGDSRDTYRGDSRGGRGGRDRGGRGRGEYERPPRHQQQNGDYGSDRSSNHGYQQSDRGHFDDRPRRDGPRGGRGGGREQRGYEEDGAPRPQRQWMDRDTSVGGGRGRAAPREPEEDVPFTGTMEFRRGGRRPFVHRGGRD